MFEKFHPDNKWIYENGFHLTSNKSRLEKIITHYNIFKKTTKIHGDIFEFGVFKGNSLIRLATFRDMLNLNKKIYGFDVFGKFPRQKDLHDNNFIKKFEEISGDGISLVELKKFLKIKKITNFELCKGDILKSLRKFLLKNKQINISLLHIDVDVYAPTKIILENLYDKVSKNGIIIFDDYSIIKGETDAINDFFESRKIKKNFKKIKFSNGPFFHIKK